jgi:hypothetical protein
MVAKIQNIHNILVSEANFAQIKYVKQFYSLNKINRLHRLMNIELYVKSINIYAIEKSIELLVKKHESLRTYFLIDNSQISQCVIPYSKKLFYISYYDVKVQTNIQNVKNRILNSWTKKLGLFTKPPLFKCLVIRHSEHFACVLIIIHHIISDMWSLNIIRKEIKESYNSIIKGELFRPEPLKIQLRTYGQNQIRWYQDNKGRLERVWQGRLSSLISLVQKNQPINMYSTYKKTSGLLGINKSNRELLEILTNVKTITYCSLIVEELLLDLRIVATILKVSFFSIVLSAIQITFQILFEKNSTLIPILISIRRNVDEEKIIGCLLGGTYVYYQIKAEVAYYEYVIQVYFEIIKAFKNPIYDHKEIGLDGDFLRLWSDISTNYINKKMQNHQTFNFDDTLIRKHITGDHECYPFSSTFLEFDNCMLINWKYNPCLYSIEIIEEFDKIFLNTLNYISTNSRIQMMELINTIKLNMHPSNK